MLKGTYTQSNIKSYKTIVRGKTKSESTSSTSTSSDNNMNENIKLSKKAYAILLQSFKMKQLTLIANIQTGVWNKINEVYGLRNTTDTHMSLLDQLKNIKKYNKESMEDYS